MSILYTDFNYVKRLISIVFFCWLNLYSYMWEIPWFFFLLFLKFNELDSIIFELCIRFNSIFTPKILQIIQKKIQDWVELQLHFFKNQIVNKKNNKTKIQLYFLYIVHIKFKDLKNPYSIDSINYFFNKNIVTTFMRVPTNVTLELLISALIYKERLAPKFGFTFLNFHKSIWATQFY